MGELPEWVTPKQAAALLHRHVASIYRIADAGGVRKLPTRDGTLLHLRDLVDAEAKRKPGRPRRDH